ncbi:polyketide cyclase [Sporocytophaga myxococcoides]|uniref:Polyketide cyclase n=1 Tax=Sporocytophaga myxococcoides TaxID=153721 RepID=A0A098LJ71_9BACT|nr:SRPBCC family protein [Sporocytophaga myxococcoides]GAL86203.1 polyketide cyclase [Sporocytophaga myxococcoides]
MKILGFILLGILGLIALLLITAIFVPKEYAIEREVTINKPKAQVFEYIKHVKNQNYFNEWVMMDPRMNKEYRGTDANVGFVFAWDGEKAGKGEQEIKNISEGEKVDLELRFIKPFESTAYAYLVTESEGNEATKVKWGMTGKSKYPFNFMNLMISGTLGTQLDKGLQKLKVILEK